LIIDTWEVETFCADLLHIDRKAGEVWAASESIHHNNILLCPNEQGDSFFAIFRQKKRCHFPFFIFREKQARPNSPTLQAGPLFANDGANAPCSMYYRGVNLDLI